MSYFLMLQVLKLATQKCPGGKKLLYNTKFIN